MKWVIFIRTDSKPMDRTGTAESTVTAHKDLPIPNKKLKRPNKKILDAKGAIRTAEVAVRAPIKKTNLWPYFSQR